MRVLSCHYHGMRRSTVRPPTDEFLSEGMGDRLRQALRTSVAALQTNGCLRYSWTYESLRSQSLLGDGPSLGGRETPRHACSAPHRASR